jgi:hypothetical protein
MTNAKDPVAKAIASARKRRLATAQRSLKLVKDVTDQHLGLLESGQVPEADFVTSAVKYAQALGELRTLDMVLEAAGAQPSANGTIEVGRDDVAVLLEVLRGVVPAAVLPEGDGGPLDRLTSAVSDEQEPVPGTVPG